MPYNIKDAETEQLLARLHHVTQKSKADLLRELLKDELARREQRLTTAERLAPLRAKLKALGEIKPIDWDELKRQSDEDWGE